jgi:threonine dehydrogenase-like Zn-dependent dehydrogenase
LARCLIIGCGCRGQMLARELVARGHAVRGTTRDPSRTSEIEAAGAEAVLADPDRVATLVGALEHVTVACVLLGSASGSEEQLVALHSTRLEMLLTKVVDTTIRGVVYETRGTLDPAVLEGGAKRVRGFGERSLAGWALLDADPALHASWLEAALAAVDEVLARG